MIATFLNESCVPMKLDLSSVSDVEAFCWDFVEENFPEYKGVSIKGLFNAVYSVKGCEQPIRMVIGEDWIVFGGIEKISGSSSVYQNIVLVTVAQSRVGGGLAWNTQNRTSLTATKKENLKKLFSQLDMGMKLLSSAKTAEQADTIFTKMREGKTVWKAAVK